MKARVTEHFTCASGRMARIISREVEAGDVTQLLLRWGSHMVVVYGESGVKGWGRWLLK